MSSQQTRSFSRYASGTASAFLAERIRENSNLEIEWRWAAVQVTNINERRYCLERALFINPNNLETRRDLSKLAPELSRAGAPAPMIDAKRVSLLGS
jgi:hypothetical protein